MSLHINISNPHPKYLCTHYIEVLTLETLYVRVMIDTRLVYVGGSTVSTVHQ